MYVRMYMNSVTRACLTYCGDSIPVAMHESFIHESIQSPGRPVLTCSSHTVCRKTNQSTLGSLLEVVVSMMKPQYVTSLVCMHDGDG